MAEEYRLSLFGSSLMPLFSEIMISDSEAIWKIYGMNIWRRQSQLPAKSRLYRLFVMLPKASQTSRVKGQQNYFAA
jgi:hypothetical protein